MAVEVSLVLKHATYPITISDSFHFSKEEEQQSTDLVSAALEWLTSNELYSTFNLTGKCWTLINGQRTDFSVKIPPFNCPLGCVIEWA